MLYSARLRLTILSGMVVILVGCVAVRPAPPTPTHHLEAATVTTTATPQTATQFPTNTPAPTSTSVPTPTMTPTVPLSTEGPWLVFAARNSSPRYLWAVNADGTGLTRLNNDYTRLFAVSSSRTAAGEVHVAYVTSDGARPTDLELSIVTLPGGQIENVTPLTSSETAYTDQDPNDEDSNYWVVNGIASAISWEGSLQWSPDGKWLAFVGAMDGLSADVYSYDLTTGIVRRLSSESDNAFQLLWSPDSRWILHTAKGIWGHSGGFYEPVSGVWAASPDGEQVIKLEGARATKFIGWIAVDTVVAYSGGAYGFEYGLRAINVTTGTVTELEPRCFLNIAYSLQHNVYLVSIGEYSVEACHLAPDWGVGVYLVSENSIRHISDDPFGGSDLRWDPYADMFLIRPYGGAPVMGITLQGEFVTDLPDALPGPSVAISEDGLFRAWWSVGGLYTASAPDYLPHPVPDTDVLSGNNLTWTP